MADKKIATGSSSEGVQDQSSSKAAKEKKRISESTGNVKLEQGAESTESDSKGSITQNVKAVEGDVNVKEITTPIKPNSDSKGEGDGGEENEVGEAYLFLDSKEGREAFAREFKKILEQPDDDGLDGMGMKTGNAEQGADKEEEC